MGSIPGQGTKIPQAMKCGQRGKKREIKHILATKPSHPAPMYLPQRNESLLPYKYLYMNVHSRLFFVFFFLRFIYFILLAVVCLNCCKQAFSSCSERGLLFIAVFRLLIAGASHVVKYRL